MFKKQKRSFEMEKKSSYLEIIIENSGEIIFNNVDKNSLKLIKNVSKLDSQDISYFCG